MCSMGPPFSAGDGCPRGSAARRFPLRDKLLQGAYPMPAMAGKGQHRADGGRAEVPAFGRAQGSAIGQGLADLFGEFLEG